MERKYFTGSDAGEIYALDREKTTEYLSNKGIFINNHGEVGAPNGATIDAQGYQWTAR